MEDAETFLVFGEGFVETSGNQLIIFGIKNFTLDASDKLEPGCDEDEVPEAKPDPKVVRGEVYILGNHRLMCGDSTSPTDVEALMGGLKADMVMTDPPYNVDYTGGTSAKMKIMNDSMDDSSFYEFLLAFYRAFAEVTKDGGAWYVWHADSEGANFRKAFRDSGLLLKQCLVWVKNSMVMGRQDYQWKHEPSGNRIEYFFFHIGNFRLLRK